MAEMAKHFSQKNKNINSSIENIFKILPEKDDDQLLMAVKLL